MFSVYWAQRSHAEIAEKNVLYLTISVKDADSPSFKLTSSSIHYHSEAHGTTYDLNLDLFADIDPENSHYSHGPQGTTAVIRKAKAQDEYWPRLTKEKTKYFFIKTDFDKWVDEDEQDLDESGADLGGADDFDLGGLGGADNGNQLLESLRDDARASGKNLDDFTKQYGINMDGKDESEDDVEENDPEIKSTVNDVLS